MRKPWAAVGSAGFFVAAPGVVAGLIPWWLTGGWRVRQPLPDGLAWLIPPALILGGVLVLAGVAILVDAFVRFVSEGRGTPAPAAPPERLVVGGFYRYVRNPMYVAVLAILLGQALLLGRPVLLGYATAVWAATATFVRWYEEPTLASQFGAAYQAYRTAVPAWWPRLRPWKPDVGSGRESHATDR